MHPSKNSPQTNIIPRVHRQSQSSENDDYESDEISSKKVLPDNRNAIKVGIPDDFHREMLQLRIPNHRPKQVKKKRRTQTVSKAVDAPIEEDEDEDESNNQEEEEEVEEKKEKVHKLTIKKKRPFMNNTKPLPQRSSNASPYKTFLNLSHNTAADSAPLTFHNTKLKPLMLQENVTILNPDQYDSGLSSVHKDVKTRDVNLIVRAKHSPRILIRRYKPLFGSFMGLNYLDRNKHPLRKPLGISGESCKKCKKWRKRNKFRHRKNKNYLPTSLLSDAETVMRSHSHISPKPSMPFSSPCDEHSLSLLPQAHHVTSFATYPHQPVHDSEFFSSHRYSPSAGNYDLHENQIASHLSSQPLNKYYEMPSENHYSPYTTHTGLPLVAVSTELPHTTKREYIFAKEYFPQTYDVHEHENTEELAANHEQETNDDLDDDEKNASYYENGESENDGEGEGENVVQNYDDEEELPESNT